MNILLTGGTGFLGQTAVRMLSTAHKVWFVGRNQSSGQALEAETGATFIHLDLERTPIPNHLLKGIDTLIHAAALSSPWGSYRDFYSANVSVTRNLLIAAKKNNIRRFIFISTPSVYFDFQSQDNIPETFLPPTFCNHYANTKWQAEQAVLQAGNDQFSVYILRPRGLFGPGDTSLMPRLLRVARKGILPKFGQDHVRVDLTYVDNVVTAIECALRAPDKYSGQVFNITNGEAVDLYQTIDEVLKALNISCSHKALPYTLGYWVAGMLELIYTLLPGEPALTRYSVGVLSKSQTLDISKASALLGYTPVVSMKEGIQQYVRWYRRNH